MFFEAVMQTAEQMFFYFFMFTQIYIHLNLLAARIRDSLHQLSYCASFLLVYLLMKSFSNQINQVIKSKNSPN